MRYRPWGPVIWAQSLSNQKKWGFVGALGTEMRSLCSWSYLRRLGSLRQELFAQIKDVDSEKYRERTRVALESRHMEFSKMGGRLSEVVEIDLMAELFLILDFARRAELLGSSVVLDITSFPKRFFFPLLRILVASEKVKNLLLTYTSAGSYADDAPLYENIEPWRTLPGFGGALASEELLIVSVGFLVESLRKHVGDNPRKKMKLFIPFPASLSVLRRTWESVANLERDYTDDRFEKIRVDTLDVSAAFDRIKSLAGNPEKALAFAPFGPKPTSAAMCLYALQKDSSVHYPQPTVYHPEYSKGILNDDPASAICAYWIKHEGENLYAL